MSVSRLQNLQGDLMSIAQQYNRTVACTAAYYEAHKNDPKATSPFPDGCFIYIKDDTEEIAEKLINLIYPVGSVYQNALVQTDPNVLFGVGTWERITGRFLYGVSATDTLGVTGGSATVTLTEDNLPASVSFTLPSVPLTTNTASTAHTHTTPATNAVTGTVTGASSTWVHSHSLNARADAGSIMGTLTTSALTGIPSGSFSNGTGTSTANLQHTHDFTVPAMTTGGMNQNETHSHTGSTTATSVNITDLGSEAAFNIIPPYVAVATWYRAS
jgi:hypothetical protein